MPFGGKKKQTRTVQSYTLEPFTFNSNTNTNSKLNFLKNPKVSSFTGVPNSDSNNISMSNHNSLHRTSRRGSKNGSLHRTSRRGSTHNGIEYFNPNVRAVSTFHTLRRPSYAPPPPPASRFTVGENNHAVPSSLGTGYAELQKELFTFGKGHNSTRSNESNDSNGSNGWNN